MSKSFLDQIENGNSFTPNFKPATPVKVESDNIHSVISTNIDRTNTDATSSRNLSEEPISDDEVLSLLEDNEKDLEKLNDEIIKLREDNAFLKAENKKLSKENSRLRSKKDSSSNTTFFEKINSYDLTANGRKFVLAVYNESLDGKWVSIPRTKIIDDYGVHVSFFKNSRLEAIEKELIEYKEDYLEGTKRKASFYKYKR